MPYHLEITCSLSPRNESDETSGDIVYSFNTTFLIGNSPFGTYLLPYTMPRDTVFHNGLLISFKHDFRVKRSTGDLTPTLFDEEYPAKNKIHLAKLFVFQALLCVEVRGKFQYIVFLCDEI